MSSKVLVLGVILALGVNACSNMGPPRESRDPKDTLSEGMFSGKDGGLVLYRSNSEPAAQQRPEVKKTQSTAAGTSVSPPPSDAEFSEFQEFREFRRWKEANKDSPEYREFRDWMDWKAYKSWKARTK